MGLSSLLAWFRRGMKNRFLLDGPGMENTITWACFSISRRDSYAQHIFDITVKCYGDRYLVNGSLRDFDGTEYEEEVGIHLPTKAKIKIDALQPHNLPNVMQEDNVGDDWIVLDAPEIQIEVGYTDGTLWTKTDRNDFSLQVYEIVLPYFRSNHKHKNKYFMKKERGFDYGTY